MLLTIWELIQALGGVGLFLFGMTLMSTGLKNAAGDKLRGILERVTSNRFAAAGIGLLVTMGIGSSFSTVPVLAVLYVPLCQRMGFSVPATILLMSAAAALGDAGSPASDTTLGPTSGLNADGQHDHIWDTCVPTFLHFNIPLMLVSIVVAQFI